MRVSTRHIYKNLLGGSLSVLLGVLMEVRLE